MGARKRTRQQSASGTKAKKGGRNASFCALADGLYELRVGKRVIIDVLVTLDGELLTFVRIDGALITEIPVQGQA
jgi:hypothetical protein